MLRHIRFVTRRFRGEALDEILHENGCVNVDGELDFVSGGCLDIVEYNNTVVDEDSEFEEVEYVDEDTDEDGEFDGGEYDDEDADEDCEFDEGEYHDESGFGDIGGHKYWNTCGSDGEGLRWSSDILNESIFSDQIPDESLVVEDITKIHMFNLQNDYVSKLQFESLEIAYKFYY
ncbi:unnamed protein product [Vicia faba]|uniref:Uncharacterized protein n=1 Tax=Vicia faba TaxID=3906 RepID=A0AAV0YVH1_VICFA|nr:unnamed protein product [Vicia faba]